MDNNGQDRAMFSLLATAAARFRDLPIDDALSDFHHPSELDEKLLYRQASYHKVIQDVYSQLDTPLCSLLSEKLRKAIAQRNLLEQSAKLMLAGYWQRVSRLLSDNGIQAMVMKGPASSLQFYGNASVRGFTDLDILVDAPDLAVVIPIIEQSGYHNKDDSFAHAPKWFIQKTHHLVFTRPDSPFRIEVHNEMFDGTRDPDYVTGKLFERKVMLQWNDTALPTLCASDHALFVISHGTHHGWILLHWLVDVAAILRVKDPNFHEELSRKLHSSKLDRQFALACTLCQSVFPVRIPFEYEQLLSSCRTPSAYHLAYSKKHLMSGIQSKQTWMTIFLFTYRYQMPLACSFREKIDLAFKLWKVAPTDAQALKLPGWLMPIHLLLRPFFVMKRRLSRRIAARKHT